MHSQSSSSPKPSPRTPDVQDAIRQLMDIGNNGSIMDNEQSNPPTDTGSSSPLTPRRMRGGSVNQMKQAAQQQQLQHPPKTKHMSTDPIAIQVQDPTVMPPSIGRSNTMAHADILNFVTKQQSKSIATKELLRHVVFTVIFLTIVALQRSVFESYLMNQSLSAAFVTQEIDFELQNFAKTFTDVHQNEELRDYLLSVLGGMLDNGDHYSGIPLTSYQKNFVMSNNRLLGGVRFRQLRTAPNKGCKVPDDLRNITKLCYGFGYSDLNKDTLPFGPLYDPQRFKYQSARETGSAFVYTNVLYGLDGGGYVVDMPLSSNFTERIHELIRSGWWDSATRAVIVTMNFLNVDMGNRVSVMYLVFEMPGTGAAMPSVIFKTFRLDLYLTTTDWFRLACEILFVGIMLQMIYREIKEMRAAYASKKGLRTYFTSGWNWNELAIVALNIVCICLYADYLYHANNHPNLASSEYFPELEQLATRAYAYYNVTYFNIMLLCFQTFKYLRMNRRLYMLWKTLQHAGTDLFGFLFIFLIFVFAFVFTAWLSFGDELLEFSTFSLSFGTCWNFMIGNPPDYSSLVQTNPIIGPLFYTLFTVFIFFILANVFIAIVGKSFSVVSKSVSDQVGITEAIDTKLARCIKSTKKLAKKITKGSSKTKRSILQILESLSYPELLEKPGLTIDDVFRACGPDTTEAEAWELFEWIEKLESKKKQQTLKVKKTFDDSDDSDSDQILGSTELKPMPKSDYIEVLASLDSLREDMKRMMALIPQAQQPVSPPSPRPSPQLSIIIPPVPPAPPVVDSSMGIVARNPAAGKRRPSLPSQFGVLNQSRDNIGPPPPSPQVRTSSVPPLPFSDLLANAPAQPIHKQPASEKRDSVGPPPPTPNIRNSAHHIPTLPPPPHDHQHSHHHGHLHHASHAHDQHHAVHPHDSHHHTAHPHDPAHHIPTLPPPPHDHQHSHHTHHTPAHDHHHASHAHDQHHAHPHDPHTPSHGILHIPLTTSFHERNASASSSPASSPSSSPAIMSRNSSHTSMTHLDLDAHPLSTTPRRIEL